MTTSSKGFTLVEILVAVMLTGTLTTLALVPVVRTVQGVVDTQQSYTDYSALSRTLNFITRDLACACRLASNVITVKDHEALGGHDDDVLLFVSTSPSAQNLPAGTVVYKFAEGGMMHRDVIAGLYRWLFPGKLPNAVNTDKLNAEDGQLVLPGVSGFCVEVPNGIKEDDRRKSYSGPLPKGLFVKIKRGRRTPFITPREEGENSLDELSATIVFP